LVECKWQLEEIEMLEVKCIWQLDEIECQNAYTCNATRRLISSAAKMESAHGRLINSVGRM